MRNHFLAEGVVQKTAANEQVFGKVLERNVLLS